MPLFFVFVRRLFAPRLAIVMMANGTPSHFFEICLDTCSNWLGHTCSCFDIFYYNRASWRQHQKEVSLHKFVSLEEQNVWETLSFRAVMVSMVGFSGSHVRPWMPPSLVVDNSETTGHHRRGAILGSPPGHLAGRLGCHRKAVEQRARCWCLCRRLCWRQEQPEHLQEAVTVGADEDYLYISTANG